MLTGMFAAGGGIDSNLEVGVEKAVGQIKLASGNSWGANAGTYTVYRYILDMGTLPNNSSITKSFADYIGIIELDGIAIGSTDTKRQYRIPYAGAGTNDCSIFTTTNKQVSIWTNNNWSGYKGMAIITYFR